MSDKVESSFAVLSHIDCSAHVETKDKFSYLSWTWAISTLLKVYPTSTWDVKRFEGSPVMTTPHGVFVEVGVTVEGIERTQIHPILNHKNAPISTPSSFEVNTSIQRCLVKAIALHGLGLYIYAGEDLPPQPEPEPATQDQRKAILDLLSTTGTDEAKFYQALSAKAGYQVVGLENLADWSAKMAIEMLEKKKADNAHKEAE